MPQITYTVSDGTATTNGTLDVTYIAINDAALAVDDTFTVDEDGSVNIDVLGDDTDPENDALTVIAVDGQPITSGGTVAVANGSVRLEADGTLTFTPDTDYNGPASFTYTISDRPVAGSAGAVLLTQIRGGEQTLLLSMDLATGEQTQIGTVPFTGAAMAIDQASGYVYAIQADGNLYAWQVGTNPATAVIIANLVTGPWSNALPAAGTFAHAAMHDGALYLMAGGTADDVLLRVDLTNPTTVADVVEVADISADLFAFDTVPSMAIDPATGVVYGIGTIDDIANSQRTSVFFSYDLNTGTFAVITQLTFSMSDPAPYGDFRDATLDLAFGTDGTLYGFRGAGRDHRHARHHDRRVDARPTISSSTTRTTSPAATPPSRSATAPSPSPTSRGRSRPSPMRPSPPTTLTCSTRARTASATSSPRTPAMARTVTLTAIR